MITFRVKEGLWREFGNLDYAKFARRRMSGLLVNLYRLQKKIVLDIVCYERNTKML